MINGEVSRRSELDGLVNQYLTEDSKDNDGVSVPSHGHPQPFQQEEHVCVLPAYEHNISNQMQGHSSFMRLKNGSLADRNGLTDSLDRFFELQPKQSQEEEEEGHQRDYSEKSKEPKPIHLWGQSLRLETLVTDTGNLVESKCRCGPSCTILQSQQCTPACLWL